MAGALRRTRAATLALLLAWAAPAAGQETPDLPAGPARVEGQVVHAETGAPMPGLQVVLYALTADQVPGLRRATSDDEGRFVFAGISNDPSIGYLLGARYREVPYPGARVAFAPGETRHEAIIRVADLTASPAELRTLGVTLRVLRDAAGLRVMETVALMNDGPRTYYRVPGERGSAAAWSRTLPEGARDFRMPLGVVPEGVVRDGRALAYYGPVYPGAHELQYTYAVPPVAGDDGRESLRLPFPLAEGTRLRVLLPEGLGELEAAGLQREEAPVLEDGRRHVAYAASGPGEIDLTFRLPAARLDPAAARLTEARAVLTLDDAALRVSETYDLEVSGDGVVLSTEEAPFLHVAFPQGASDLRFGSDAAGVSLVPHGTGGLAAVGTVGPGSFQVGVEYVLTVEAFPVQWSRSAPGDVPVFSVYVADTGDLAPSSERLHRRRPARTSDLTYLHLEAFQVAANELVDLTLGKLPPRSSARGPVAFAASGVIAALAILLLAAPLRAGASPELAEETRSAVEREREAVMAAIRDVDHDFETGKLGEADHRELRTALRARAIALLREERVGGAAEPAGTTAAGTRAETDAPAEPEPPALDGPRCASCGEALAATHRFCPSCGARREATGQEPAGPGATGA